MSTSFVPTFTLSPLEVVSLFKKLNNNIITDNTENCSNNLINDNPNIFIKGMIPLTLNNESGIIKRKIITKTITNIINKKRSFNKAFSSNRYKNIVSSKKSRKNTTKYNNTNSFNKLTLNDNNKQKRQNDKSSIKIPPDCECLLDDEGNLCSSLQNSGIDPKLVESVTFDIMDNSNPITWNDIAGLKSQKRQIKEIIIWPLINPSIFRGVRSSPKGILLFGPPGTGKTMIAKAVASETNNKFFSISSSSLTSKWFGVGEKLVKTLFAVAKCLSPSIIFLDELDSLLSKRKSSEFEATRRIKTQFLIELDGIKNKNNSNNNNLLVIGATNLPYELDDAVRRRFMKKLYIPLPDLEGRIKLIKLLLNNPKYKISHNLSDNEFNQIGNLTDGYSGSDLSGLAQEASYGPLRSCNNIKNLTIQNIRPINLEDFKKALKRVRPSVRNNQLQEYIKFNNEFGVKDE